MKRLLFFFLAMTAGFTGFGQTIDGTLSKFFPQVPNAGKITIAEMLGHRTGRQGGLQ